MQWIEVGRNCASKEKRGHTWWEATSEKILRSKVLYHYLTPNELSQKWSPRADSVLLVYMSVKFCCYWAQPGSRNVTYGLEPFDASATFSALASVISCPSKLCDSNCQQTSSNDIKHGLQVQLLHFYHSRVDIFSKLASCVACLDMLQEIPASNKTCQTVFGSSFVQLAQQLLLFRCTLSSKDHFTED